MTTVTSIVTPSVTPAPVLPKGKGKPNGKGNGKLAVTLGSTSLTKEQAVKAAYDYGSCLAGQDGTLTAALKAYAKNEEVQADMLKALNVGYVERKLDVSKEEAERIVGLVKYNEKKQDDHHRTFAQERVMIAVRVLWMRAKRMAGIVEAPAKGKTEKAAESEARKGQIQELAEIVYPTKTEDVDVNAAMVRLVLTMRSYQNKYSAKFVGDTGSAWRDWLAAAPIDIVKK
jgi:hypothetical protein